MNDLVLGNDGRRRCGWCGDDAVYMAYHDEEWGRFKPDDRSQFEFIVLESAQAGLSWITILRKRNAYRKAYGDFDPELAAGWNEKDIHRLMGNAGIVRNRKKIEASVGNARAFLEIAGRYGSFGDWLLRFFNREPPLVNHWKHLKDVPVTSPPAKTLAEEMKRWGFRFFGPIIAYSHLQATGFINDHLIDCWTAEKTRSS